MSDTELLLCSGNLGCTVSGHSRECPAYYRGVVAEDKKKAVEAIANFVETKGMRFYTFAKLADAIRRIEGK